MRITRVAAASALLFLHVLVFAGAARAQGTVADYQRAMGLREKVQGLAVNVPEPATWVEKAPRFWYRKSVKGGNEFVLVDATTSQKRPAFDHEKLAAALTALIKPEKAYTGVTLPFNTFNFADGERAITLTVANVVYRCNVAESTCQTDTGGRGGRGRGGRGGGLGGPVRAEFDINGVEAK